MAGEATTIVAHYKVAQNAGEHAVHGVYGGVTPSGQICMALWSERRVVPQEIDLIIETDDEGAPVSFSEGEKRGKAGFMRTVNGTFYVPVEVAESLVSWLQTQIDVAKAGRDA